ncbi:FAD-dependent monooxygenase [Catenulispora pinisilvae]|uniref:FAD-dependent monooxygenase n=1 Tax=Catenulispora pinisilvae TaxID=2705253 RepID=UPI0018926EEB|nr:FAD-dependent monooxygenase [Catenulispora pinisilvae]
MKAIVVGAGFGGLTAAAGLHQRGWEVVVVERASQLRPVGSGLAVAPNGLRALDTLGVGDAVRKLAAFQGDAAVSRPDGRVIARTASKAMIRRFGDAVIPATRSSVMDVLVGLLPPETFRLGVTAQGVEAGDGTRRPCLLTGSAVIEADLIVAADGVNSFLRRALFPEHQGAVYSGITAWRLLVPTPAGDFLPGEVWGGGKVFGITPLADGRTYAYAADYAEAGITYPDEKAELLRRFGDWHFPIPELIEAAAPETILHNDIYEMAEPLPAYHRGAVAILGDAAHAMTPHLGQGANQAMEDGVTLAALVGAAKGSVEVASGLAQYTALRAPRGADMVRRSHRMGALTQSTSRPKEVLRNLGMGLAARLVPDLALRAMDPVVAWQPPR